MVYSTSISLKTSSVIKGHSSCCFLWRTFRSSVLNASSLVCCASVLSQLGGEWCKPSTQRSHFRNPPGLSAEAVVIPRSGGMGEGQGAGKHTVHCQRDKVPPSPLHRLAQAPSPSRQDPNLLLGQCRGQSLAGSRASAHGQREAVHMQPTPV